MCAITGLVSSRHEEHHTSSHSLQTHSSLLTHFCLLFQQVKHVLHVDEVGLNHPARIGLVGAPLGSWGDNSAPGQVRAGIRLPVVGAKPVERHVQLDDVGAKQHKVPDLWTSRDEDRVTGGWWAVTLPTSYPLPPSHP